MTDNDELDGGHPTAPLPDEELAAIESDLAKYPNPSRNGPHDPLEYARVLLAALRAERAARTLPQGTRLILASENLLDFWGTRTEDGDLLTMEWGEPDGNGWHEPTFTRHSDDNPLRAERAAPLDVERLARAIRSWYSDADDAAVQMVAAEYARLAEQDRPGIAPDR